MVARHSSGVFSCPLSFCPPLPRLDGVTRILCLLFGVNTPWKRVSLTLGFLFASRPELMGKMLGIVYRAISSHLINKAGLSRKKAQTGAVTLIQRFGSALNLNVHFHMLFLDGVYIKNKQGKTRFQHIRAPVQEELATLVHTINHRVARYGKLSTHWRIGSWGRTSSTSKAALSAMRLEKKKETLPFLIIFLL